MQDTYKKDAPKMLVKCIVNFTNILRTAFAPISFYPKNLKQNYNVRKTEKNTFVQKNAARKMLVKSTLVKKYTNEFKPHFQMTMVTLKTATGTTAGTSSLSSNRGVTGGVTIILEPPVLPTTTATTMILMFTNIQGKMGSTLSSTAT